MQEQAAINISQKHRQRLALECRKLAISGQLEALLDEIDASSKKQRIFLMGCGKSGTWLLTGIMSTFQDVAIIPAEVPVELFGLLTSSKKTQVMKRSLHSFETVEKIPKRISIL